MAKFFKPLQSSNSKKIHHFYLSTRTGTNGAGKTSLFRILTGQISPTSGTTMFNQQKVERVLAGTCKILGYCPQTDSLDSTLTPRQHLAIYSLMRGIRHSQREKVIKDSLRKFQLTQYEHFAVHSLSRGTKRKLCLAISMLGDPQIVLLVSLNSN